MAYATSAPTPHTRQRGFGATAHRMRAPSFIAMYIIAFLYFNSCIFRFIAGTKGNIMPVASYGESPIECAGASIALVARDKH